MNQNIINNIKHSKSLIKQEIEKKGVIIPNEIKIDSYSSYIDLISSKKNVSVLPSPIAPGNTPILQYQERIFITAPSTQQEQIFIIPEDGTYNIKIGAVNQNVFLGGNDVIHIFLNDKEVGSASIPPSKNLSNIVFPINNITAKKGDIIKASFKLFSIACPLYVFYFGLCIDWQVPTA